MQSSCRVLLPNLPSAQPTTSRVTRRLTHHIVSPGAGTLQAAVNAASAGDELVLETITPEEGEPHTLPEAERLLALIDYNVTVTRQLYARRHYNPSVHFDRFGERASTDARLAAQRRVAENCASKPSPPARALQRNLGRGLHGAREREPASRTPALGATNADLISREDIELFSDTWADFDPDANQSIDEADLPEALLCDAAAQRCPVVRYPRLLSATEVAEIHAFFVEEGAACGTARKCADPVTGAAAWETTLRARVGIVIAAFVAMDTASAPARKLA